MLRAKSSIDWETSSQRQLQHANGRRPVVVAQAAAATGRRAALLQLGAAAAVSLGWGAVAGAAGAAEPPRGLACASERGYALQQCLRSARRARQEAEGGEGGGGGEGGEGGNNNSSSGSGSGSRGSDDVQGERLRYRQYEQPGELVTLPSGVQYREITTGSGSQAAAAGDELEIAYTVYRLSARATPVYAWSFGTGEGFEDDLGEVYRFRLGDARAVPAAVAAGLVGMRAGGVRRVLVPPRLGFVADDVGPPPPSFTATRRRATHKREPLLFEARLVRVIPAAARRGSGSGSGGGTSGDDSGGGDALLEEEAAALRALVEAPGAPFRLPVPRSPFQKNLGPPAGG